MWEDALRAHPNATVFHGSAWARVLAETYGHRPHYLRFAHGSGHSDASLVPLMEVRSPLTGRRGVGLPFSDLCPPLLAGNAALPELQSALESLCHRNRWKHLELRGSPHTGPAPDSPAFLGHELDLAPGADSLHAALDTSVRRALRKAEREGVLVRIAFDERALRDFFALHVLTRRRLGLPPQSLAFFLNLRREGLVGPDSGFVAVAGKADRPLAAAVFLRQGPSGVYKFGASDEREWACRPNHAAMWEGIRHLTESGARSLHFGRTSLHQEGLRRFKLSWGAREHPVAYTRYVSRDRAWHPVTSTPPLRAARLAHAVFHRSPLAFNRLAGTLLYPHLD